MPRCQSSITAQPAHHTSPRPRGDLTAGEQSCEHQPARGATEHPAGFLARERRPPPAGEIRPGLRGPQEVHQCPRTPTAIAEQGELSVGPALSLSPRPIAARAERASHTDLLAVGCESGCITAYGESRGQARPVGAGVHRAVRAGASSRAKRGASLAADAALAFKDLKFLASAPGRHPARRRERDRAGDRRVADRLLLDAARPGPRVSRGGTVTRTAGQLLGDRGRRWQHSVRSK